jgi:hypothetical protein
MKRTIHPIEQEINEIRIRIYEEIKYMTPEQVSEYFRKSGEETAKKYGFKIADSLEKSNRRKSPEEVVEDGEEDQIDRR